MPKTLETQTDVKQTIGAMTCRKINSKDDVFWEMCRSNKGKS